MARGRMLSKDISLDEKVDALSDDSARLLFTWMIPHLDVEGRMYGEARIFKSIIAPRRNYSIKKVEKYLTEMESLGLIKRYIVDGNCYLLAPNFEKHQTGLRKDKEAQSKIPPKTTDLGRTRARPTQSQVEEKIKLKIKRSEEEEKASPEIKKLEFEQYIEELRPQFTDINFDNELKKFYLYWSEGGRKLQRPKLALKNWMDKARDFKKDKETKGRHNTDPDKYVKGKYGHMVKR